MKRKKTNMNEVEELENVEQKETCTEANEISAEELIKLAESKVSEYKDIAQRVLAEFENYKKRNAEIIKNTRTDAILDTVKEFLPIVDNFERAIPLIIDDNSLKGFNQIYKQFVATLDKLEVKEIEALDKPFDPTLHNAVMQVDDPSNSGKVVEVLQKGYIKNNKVLRYSMVKVAN